MGGYGTVALLLFVCPGELSPACYSWHFFLHIKEMSFYIYTYIYITLCYFFSYYCYRPYYRHIFRAFYRVFSFVYLNGDTYGLNAIYLPFLITPGSCLFWFVLFSVKLGRVYRVNSFNITDLKTRVNEIWYLWQLFFSACLLMLAWLVVLYEKLLLLK